MQECCALFGVYAPGEDVSRLTFFGLYSLQHRGQESSGIATANGEHIRVHTKMGLVAQAFDEEVLSHLCGDIAIGHNRYSNTTDIPPQAPVTPATPSLLLSMAHPAS